MEKKIIILASVAAALSFAFWFKIQTWINDPLRFQEQSIWLWPLILFIVLVAFLCLSFLLLPKGLKFAVVAANFFALLIFFGFNEILLLGIAISFLFQLASMAAVTKESKNRLQFKFYSALKPGLSRLVTSLLILISFVYFLSPAVQASVGQKELPPGIQRTIQVVVGNYIGENLEVQNPRLKAETGNQVLAQINKFIQPYFKFLPAILAFALFIVLQGLSFIFVWLSLLFAFIVFVVFKKTGLIKIEKKPQEAEIVSF